MIDRAALLADLQKLLKRLEADLLQRSESADIPEVQDTLRAEYERAVQAKRMGRSYVDWRNDWITQHSAAWVLSCVFVRYLEDNRLIDPPRIAGPNERLQRARDEHELYFRAHPTKTDREYLLHVFEELAQLPGGRDVFGKHNAVFELPNWLSGDTAGELLRFFQRINADTGKLMHDFSDPRWDVRVVAELYESFPKVTRFLGDLYQDLSETTRKQYALLQTPEFVEEFILDYTLDPALNEFGIGSIGFEQRLQRDGRLHPDDRFRLVDPACGSGHFLLGAFRRILKCWQTIEPEPNRLRLHVQRTLDSIYGVDVNPYAVAIARFRLLLAGMRTCGIARLSAMPAFEFNLACGDSLLHAPLHTGHQVFDFALASDDGDCDHAYRTENLPDLKRILRPGYYHAVVANPPYITPKDRILNEAYRKRFPSCHRQYSLAVPFMEQLFRLAINGDRRGSAGFVGQITANSFMKREFGTKLVEVFFPSVDFTHVIDTSGAYIPGHGTPTVILFGRNRKPVLSTIRTVMGVRGEPSTPDDPAQGLVWSAIVAQIDRPDLQSDFVSVKDSQREVFYKHPWSIGGGGAAELKEQLNATSAQMLINAVETISAGICITREDDAYLYDESTLSRRGIEAAFRILSVKGEHVRNWQLFGIGTALFPYDEKLTPIDDERGWKVHRLLWPYKELLWRRRELGGDHRELGRTWWEWNRFLIHRYITPFSIAYGEVATHNHFVLDRGDKVFNRTAPVIKLSRDATENDHLPLLGLLNSSVGCFWLKQVCHNKGSTVDQHGARQRTAPFEDFFAFNGTKLKQFPLPEGRPLDFARRLDQLANDLGNQTPIAALRIWQERSGSEPASEPRPSGSGVYDRTTKSPVPDGRGSLRLFLSKAHSASVQIRGEMMRLQEDLDWQCYYLYGLIDDKLIGPPPGPSRQRTSRARQEAENSSGDEQDRFLTGAARSIRFGERAFEIVLARKMAAGAVQTTWFERHKSAPITELPADWPDDYRRLVERRIEVIESNPQIALIEQPEYKRRWNAEPWDSQVETALRNWLLDRLEGYFDFDGRMAGKQSAVGVQRSARAEMMGARCFYSEAVLTTVAKLADIARQDAAFMEVGEVYRDDAAFDVERLVNELVGAEHVPLLPVLSYKPSGLRKRQQWEKTWELQREEDRLQQQLEAISSQLEAISDQQSAVSKLEQEKLNAERQRLAAEKERLTAESRKLTASIPVPPKYTSADFISTGGARYWSLRGKLDVPKERWVSFPHCEGPDGTLVIAWAGYDHLGLARAISAYYVEVQEHLGGRDDPRLAPLLAGLIELVPWLKQWHNDIDPEYNVPMGDYFEGFVTEEAKNLGMTIEEIRGWQPPAKGAKGRKRVAKGQRNKGAEGEDG